MLLLLCLLCVTFSIAQETYYYSFVKATEPDSKTKGGQFVTFSQNSCYDSDKDGYTVNNGILKLDNYTNGIYTYRGESFWGDAIYKFNSDKSYLNIIVHNNKYIYKRTPAPSGTMTCSLILNKNTNQNSSGQPIYIPANNYAVEYNIGTYNPQNNTSNSANQKTKARKDCAYCSGKGEIIQHEYVATYGTNGARVYCSKCNQSWNHGTVHAHHRCNHCNGKGYYEYEY